MIGIGIITCSDKGSKGEREDVSGQTIKNITEGVYKTIEYEIIPDDKDIIKSTLLKFANNKEISLILTTGGTGFSHRDITPEATKEVIQREITGIPEAMRSFSLKYSKNAMLSRGIAGIINDTIIVNLPGSPKAVRECLEYILDPLNHGLGVLLGSIKECGHE
ncbi:MAG: molybdenum cofactor biosynthesis protein B [Lachnospirales bacterium]